MITSQELADLAGRATDQFGITPAVANKAVGEVVDLVLQDQATALAPVDDAVDAVAHLFTDYDVDPVTFVEWVAAELGYVAA